MPHREQEAVMSAFSITNPAPSERRLTRGILFLLAGLAALGALATNIILPAFLRIGANLAVSSQELGLTLSSFFVAFAFGQVLAGPLSDRFGRKCWCWAAQFLKTSSAAASRFRKSVEGDGQDDDHADDDLLNI
jgi:MFS transporter, DHA1 family, multidrug resistance protein